MKKQILPIVLFSALVTENINAQTWSGVGTGMSSLVDVLGVYNGELYAGRYLENKDYTLKICRLLCNRVSYL